MLKRSLVGAWCAVVLVAAAPPGCVSATGSASTLGSPQAPARPTSPGGQPSGTAQPDGSGPLDDDVTIAAFLQQLEPIVQGADIDGYVALEGPLGSVDDARAFAQMEFQNQATRVVIQERDRQEVTLSGIPGGAFALTVDAFIEYGNRARVATWQLLLRRADASWNIIRQQSISSVENLFKLVLNTTRQYDVRNLAIRAEDLQLTLVEGNVFTVDTEQGVTGLVVMGRGDLRFAPAPETEKGQVRIFTGSSEVLETRFDGAFVRFGAAGGHVDLSALVERPVDQRDLKRAQQIFREESPKSFAVDLADLTREAWTLPPGPDDFLAEIRTRRYDTLTYTRSASEPEDISLFERRRHKNISIYPSKEKLAARGRFYNEDDLASYDVLDYDIDVTSLPDREWVQGRARLRLKSRTPALGQLTLKLADTLVVRSITSDRFGRMFNLRVTNQNTILVNMPSLLDQGEELTLTIVYSGRLEPQSPDRETLLLQDDPSPRPPSVRQEFPNDFSLPRVEPSYLYSNRSFWYPQSTVTDYATATIRLSVPIDYGAVASGDPIGSPQIVTGTNDDDARRTYVFKASRPARYLSFIVSRFVPVEGSDVIFSPDALTQGGEAASADTPIADMRVMAVANPRQTRQAGQILSRAADIVKFYQQTVGDAPYPSFTLALVESLVPGGHSPAYFAQLNQPLPNSPLVWRNDPAAFENYPEFFMAHEIAHQWWGQAVSGQNYHEQWISEGFSQYFAALYANEYRGDDVFLSVLKRMRRWAMNESDQGPVYLGYRIGHIKNNGRAFRAIVYNKGAMVLHMLRLMVGDQAFFEGLKRFYASSRFHKVGTEDFRLTMEQQSGLNLERFFERWIYGATLPAVAFTSRVEAGTGGGQEAVLRFEQTGGIFDMPVLVTLTYADGKSDDVLVRIDDRVVEKRIELDGPLRSASISKHDVTLADFR